MRNIISIGSNHKGFDLPYLSKSTFISKNDVTRFEEGV